VVKRKAVFLDRDGVINRSIIKNGKGYAPRSLAEFELLPGVEEATAALKKADFLLFVVTNQPDIGNGLISPDIVDQMHQLLIKKLPLTKIYMCPHRQDENCACRKPKPGMLLMAKDEFDIDMKNSFMVCDRVSDVQAGISAGCTPFFIDHNYIETPDLGDIVRAKSLLQVIKYIFRDGVL
jgi:D-glycero-D-manno-heptose 1,7-bisphosphate phosphatase